jgi:hypothetical protein
VPGMPPRSDFIEERIIFINDTLVESRIQAHGPPPNDIQQQRDWYREALRESLQVAAHTRYNPRKRSASPSMQASQPSPERLSRSSTQNTGYDTPMMPVTHQSQMSFLPGGSSGMSFQQTPFLTSDQQQANMMATMSNGITAGETPMAGDIMDSWIYTPDSMSEETAPQLDPRFNYEFHAVEYGQPVPDLQPDPRFPSGWPGHQEQQRRR